MSLRDLAARDRARILTDPMGVGEDTVYTPSGQDGITGRGLWSSLRPSDTPHTNGIGAQTSYSYAVLTISGDFAPDLTRADTFTRVATGEVWNVEQIEVLTGVGYRLILSRPDDETVRGVRG